MSGDYTVRRYGTDTSGRTIYLTVYMHDWWENVVKQLGFRPTIIQGAFMVRDGGGAKASAGYHDAAGCMDVRTRDLTTTQIDRLIAACRRNGAAAWRRDKTPAHGGMDPHCHMTLGSDFPLSEGARTSWHSYVTGGDGLAGDRRDYEARPKPLVLTPPEDPMVQLLKDIRTVAKAHNVSMLYVARVALSGVTSTAGSPRALAVRAARAVLRPFK